MPLTDGLVIIKRIIAFFQHLFVFKKNMYNINLDAFDVKNGHLFPPTLLNVIYK